MTQEYVKNQDVRQLDRRRLRRTAYHEAGHALADFIFCFRVRRVSIIPNDATFGRVHKWKKLLKQREFIEFGVGIFSDLIATRKIARWHDEVVVLLAGGEAERILAPGSKFRTGMLGDLNQASNILERLSSRKRITARFQMARGAGAKPC